MSIFCFFSLPGIIIFCIYFVINFYKYKKLGDSFRDSICIAITISFFMLIIIVFLDNCEIIQQNNEFQNKQDIQSISNNLNYSEYSTYSKNSFFLGIDSVTNYLNTSLAYYVIVGNNKSGLTIKKLDTTTTHLFLDSDQNPYYIESYSFTTSQEQIKIFGKILAKEPVVKKAVLDYVELHVPKNTVKIQYINVK